MSLPNSLRAYSDCAELFVRATTDPKGARACVGTWEAGINLRTRMHYFRKLDRIANERTYPSDHPSHGQSVYDEYVIPEPIRDQDGMYWLYIEPRRGKILAIEGLSETHLVGGLIEAEGTEVLAIEDKTNG
jgi:hypothetical protein